MLLVIIPFLKGLSQCNVLNPSYDCITTPCERIRNSNFECSGWSSPGCDFGGYVYCWYVTNGDPFYPTLPYSSGNWSASTHEAVFSVNTDVGQPAHRSSQGIYQNTPISNGFLYFVSLDYRVPSNRNYGLYQFGGNWNNAIPSGTIYSSLDNIYVKFSDNNSFATNICNQPLPNPTSQQQLQHIQNITNDDVVHQLNLCAKADANYESLWLYAVQNSASSNGSGLVVDNVYMYEADAGTNQTVSCNSNIFLGSGCATIPGATYSWSPAIGLSSTTSLQTNLNTSLLSLGVHTYTLTVNYNGCIITDQVQITVQGPTVNLGPNQLICNGSSVNLNAGAGFANYQWSQPGTCLFGGPNMNACVTGNYCVTVTDANGCTASDCAYITISNMPNISILCTDPDICSGESVTLSANPACIGCTYSWSPGGATSNSITVSPAVTTNYSVLVTNAQGCFDFASQQVTVDQNCPPTSLCMHIDQTGNTDVGRRVTATSDGGFVAIGDISGAHNAADRDLYVIKY